MKCRLCLKKCNMRIATQLFANRRNEEEPALEASEMILKYMRLKLTPDDEVSTMVCCDCFSQLEDFHEFCVYVEEQQKTLFSKMLKIKSYDNHLNITTEPVEEILIENCGVSPVNVKNVLIDCGPSPSKHFEKVFEKYCNYDGDNDEAAMVSEDEEKYDDIDYDNDNSNESDRTFEEICMTVDNEMNAYNDSLDQQEIATTPTTRKTKRGTKKERTTQDQTWDKQVNVKSLLNYFHGRQVTKCYNKLGRLDDLHRKILCDCIIDFIFENGFIGAKQVPAITAQIEALFPSEKQELYFSRKPKCNATGIFYHRYYNRLKINKKRQIRKRLPKNVKKTQIKKDKEGEPDMHENPEVLERSEIFEKPEFDEISDEIPDLPKNNIAPKYSTKRHMKMWRETFEYRQLRYKRKNANIAEIINGFKILTRDDGHILINEDFKEMHGCKKDIFAKNWKRFTQRFLSDVFVKVRDKETTKILELYSNSGDDKRDVSYFLALHAILKPVYKVKCNDKFWLPSITASQDSFYLQVSKPSELENLIKARRKYRKNLKMTECPYIIGLDEDEEDKSDSTYTVIYHSLRYSFDNFLEAVYTCFQIFIVFDLKFPPESHLVWKFIKLYLFQIECNVNLSIKKLVSDLQST